MNITKSVLFELLNGHYLTTGDKINEPYLNEAIILAVDNTRWIYDQMLDNWMLSATSIAFLGFQDIVKDIIRCNDYSFVGFDLGPVLVEWLAKFGRGYASLAESIEHVKNERMEHTMNNTVDTIEINDYTCTECGCILNPDQLHEVDGEYYCDECFEENFVVCVNCDEIIRKDGSEYHHNGEYYCEDCFNDNFVLCHHCEEYVRINDATYIDYPRHRYYVCPDCLEYRYVECQRCGDYIHNDDSYTVCVDEDQTEAAWCEHCWEYHTWTCRECDSCYSDDVERYDGCCPNCNGSGQDTGDINDWAAPKGVKNYLYKPTACFCPVYADDQIFYGFELEAESHGNSCNNWADQVNETLGYTYVKHDGSLNDGMEIVSHPATLEYHMSKKDAYTDLFAEMREAGWRSHDDGTCGLHVHVSLKPMEERNPSAVANLLILFDRFWNNLVKFSRRKDEQLRRWAKRYGVEFDDYADIKRKAKGCRDRYMAVNLENTHTVEIRMFRGTLNPDTFFATLQLVDVIVNKAIDLGEDEAAVNGITWEELVESDHEELNAYLAKRHLLDDEYTDTDEEIEEAIVEALEDESHDFIRLGDTVRVCDTYGLGIGGCRGTVVGFDAPFIALAFDPEDLPDHSNCYLHDCVSSETGEMFAPERNGRWFTRDEICIPF